MENQPLVSVIISTYNRPEKLDRAIESVVKQSYRNWELFIVDDCSPGEETQKIGKKWAESDERINYIRAEKNHGYGNKPRNTGILASKGDFICYLDDDCEFLTRHIERLVAEIQATKADIVYCDMWLVDEEGRRGEGIAMDFDGQFLINKNFIDTNEVLHTRDIIFAVGGWDETLPRFMDWNLWVRMMKWGAKFHHVSEKLALYHISPDSTAVKHPVEMYRDPVFGTIFKPTFNPSGCYIYGPWLGDDREAEKNPRVAIFTLSYDRLEYTQQLFKNMQESAEYGFGWYVLDQGSKDGSAEYLKSLMDGGAETRGGKPNGWLEKVEFSPDNLGITGGSNRLLDMILKENSTTLVNGEEVENAVPREHQIIIKVDNDCLFLTKGWLATVVDLWKRNHRLYMSPYVEGLVQNPGGAQRVGFGMVGDYMVEVTRHIGGIFAAIDARAYQDFRWTDQFLHGNQDAEASQAFRERGYMPMYIPIQRIQHIDGTEGQHQKFPEYFERRKKEKTQVYQKGGE